MSAATELLRQEIMAMAEKDLSIRRELIEDGTLTAHGYHPRMEAVHQQNASRLVNIIRQHGWPGESLVGKEGAHAAWLIAQHAIGNPSFMRQCLSLIQQAAADNEVPHWHAAMLEDRIRMYEGRPQLYGTQFQPNEDGRFIPYTIQDPQGVDERRRKVGLNTMQEKIAEIQQESAQEKITLPDNWKTEYEAWLYAAGWREK